MGHFLIFCKECWQRKNLNRKGSQQPCFDTTIIKGIHSITELSSNKGDLVLNGPKLNIDVERYLDETCDKYFSLKFTSKYCQWENKWVISFSFLLQGLY